MALDRSIIGHEVGPVDVEWTSRDSLLYALGVGAGQADPAADLAFTTENTHGVVQRALPTYAVVIVQNASARPDLGPIDRTRLVHAEQGFELHRPLPVAGRVRVTSRVTGIYDKGSGALVCSAATAVDPESGEPVITTTSSAFIRGEGGFGGDRGPASGAPHPEGPPDLEVHVATRHDQALLYRLSGDRNPLHSDPGFATRGGFSRPILHGLCTYGITGRILLNECGDGDPDRIRSMSARFTQPVLPGDSLTVQAWRSGDEVHFRTLGPSGDPVIDHGFMLLASPA